MRPSSVDRSNPTVLPTSSPNEGPSFHFLRLSLSTAIVVTSFVKLESGGTLLFLTAVITQDRGY